ncbi:hypothetical protein a10_06214 [Streptomyces acidiscabies]|nr:hypothetical protein a10_06214 [Streptomyces acidiscabies]
MSDNIHPSENRRIPPLHGHAIDSQKLELTLNGIQLRIPPLLRNHHRKMSEIDAQGHRGTDPAQIDRTQPEITAQRNGIPIQRTQHLRVHNKFVETHN